MTDLEQKAGRNLTGGRTPAFEMRGTLAVLTLFVFLNYLDRYALSILLEPIKTDLRLSDTQIGLLTGAAFALLYSTMALPVARLAEHGNRIYVLVGAVLIWSSGTALCGVAGGFVGLFLARMLVGLGESGAIAPAQSIIGDGVPLARRGSALAILSTGGALGTALAPAIGGALETKFGWRGAFLALGAIGLPVAVLVLAMAKDPPRGHSDGLSGSASRPPPFMVAIKRLFARPSFALLVPAMVATGLAEYSFFLWLPSYFARAFGETTIAIGTQLTLFQGVPLLAGTMLGGVLCDRLIRRDMRWMAWLPALGTLVAAASMCLLFLLRSKELALAMLIIPSIACGLYLAPAYAMIQTLAGARSRATATAVLTFLVNIIGLGLGPVLIGGISDLLHARFGDDSLRYALFVVPPLYVISGLAYLAVSLRFRAGLASVAQENVTLSDVSDT
ncbi:MFS transporter [Sphingomonas sp. MG17]|uniref:MFS transporter n=1 Tax=Sphingomonas tagetis TaxID=2949092 RepID=A0A9X2KNN9_9SPHN|nr:MFS transporter [Sphingomonas tagetis]MCP3732731.1 MFS transporter [Sphingomonas tagetis]